MKYAAAALILFALPAPAAAQDVCDAIAGIAAAAAERPAFASLGRSLAEGRTVMPGFAANECSVAESGVDCRETMQRGGPSPIGRTSPLCPGLIAFEPPPPPPPAQRIRSEFSRSYRLGRFRIDHWINCPRCAALGPSHFRMRIEDRRRPEE